MIMVESAVGGPSIIYVKPLENVCFQQKIMTVIRTEKQRKHRAGVARKGTPAPPMIGQHANQEMKQHAPSIVNLWSIYGNNTDTEPGQSRQQKEHMSIHGVILAQVQKFIMTNDMVFCMEMLITAIIVPLNHLRTGLLCVAHKIKKIRLRFWGK